MINKDPTCSSACEAILSKKINLVSSANRSDNRKTMTDLVVTTWMASAIADKMDNQDQHHNGQTEGSKS